MALHVTIHPLPVNPPPESGGENTAEILGEADAADSVLNGFVIQALGESEAAAPFVAAIQIADITKSLVLGSAAGLATKDFLPEIEGTFSGLVINGLADIAGKRIVAAAIVAGAPEEVVLAVPAICLVAGAVIGYFAAKGVGAAFKYLETNGPSLVQDATQQASIFASNIETLGNDIGTAVSNALENLGTAIPANVTTVTDYVTYLTSKINSSISDEIKSITTSVGDFLSAMNVQAPDLGTELSQDVGSVESWLSGAITSVTAKSIDATQPLAGLESYTQNNAPSAPTDLTSILEAQLANSQQQDVVLPNGITYAPSADGSFSLTQDSAFGSGTSSTETYDSTGRLISQNDLLTTGTSLTTYSDTGVVNQDNENYDGTSKLSTYNPDGSSVSTSYDGPNGTGSIVSQDVENSDGTSRILENNTDGSSSTVYFSGPGGTGTITREDVVNADGSSASLVYATDGTVSETYSGPDVSVAPIGVSWGFEHVSDVGVPVGTLTDQGNSWNLDLGTLSIDQVETGDYGVLIGAFTDVPDGDFTSDESLDFFSLDSAGHGFYDAARGHSGFADVITIDDLTPGEHVGIFVYQATLQDSSGQTVLLPEQLLTVTGNVVACFLGRTHVATTDGEVPVEDLAVGDQVLARFAGVASIKWIGRRHVDCRKHPQPAKVWPVRVRSGAFGEGMPCRDLWLSPDHAVFVDDVLIPIKYLINGTSIVQVEMAEVTYYHVELAQHDVLLAEGMPAESFLPDGDRSMFDNGGCPVQLHPDFRSLAWEALGCAPLIVTGAALAAVQQRLQARANEGYETGRQAA